MCLHQKGYNRLMAAPLVSVCVPVYGTERFLARCLESIFRQNFRGMEVVVLNDGSSGLDGDGQDCRRIVRKSSKRSHIKTTYLEHRENSGLVEARRSLVHAARGEYVLMLDSDDFLCGGALSALYGTAVNTGADIVHGATVTFIRSGEKIIPVESAKNSRPYRGTLEKRAILDGWLLDGNHSSNLWGKLIRRSRYVEAFGDIPRTYCNMAEDLLIYFFVAMRCEKYVGIEIPAVNYCVSSGMTAPAQAGSVEEFRRKVSSASVFTVIFSWCERILAETGRNPLSDMELDRIRTLAKLYVMNSVEQLRCTVPPELADEARGILCEYWGENLVSLAERNLAR